jgi:hypothetical protein
LALRQVCSNKASHYVKELAQELTLQDSQYVENLASASAPVSATPPSRWRSHDPLAHDGEVGLPLSQKVLPYSGYFTGPQTIPPAKALFYP